MRISSASFRALLLKRQKLQWKLQSFPVCSGERGEGVKDSLGLM